MSKRNIYVVGDDTTYANWMEGRITGNMEAADLVVFTGGEDVSPDLYGKKCHPTTSYNRRRDAEEIKEFKRAREMGRAMLGVCRGAQFLAVMAGGELVQHQQHPYLHDVVTDDGRTIRVNSTHHQRQYIRNLSSDKVKLIAWAEHLSPYAYGESRDDKLDEDKEVEIAYYPEIKALAIQSHPEMVYYPREEWQVIFVNYCRELLDKYL